MSVPERSSTIGAVIFDFGNVLAFFDHRRAFETIAERLGRPVAEAGWDWFQSLEGRRVLVDYESGTIDTLTFHEGVTQGIGLSQEELSLDLFREAWNGIFTPNRPVLELAYRVKRSGFRLLVGSNTNPLHVEVFDGAFAEALGPFDAQLLSFRVGAMKPAPTFYRACVAASGLEASACLFIDDLEVNVDGARASGLEAIVYRDPDQLRNELEDRGLLAT